MKLGVYRHYKGNLYQVIGVARHEESHELLVIYRALYGNHDLWARSYDVFCESVSYENKEVPRFEFVGEKNDSCLKK